MDLLARARKIIEEQRGEGLKSVKKEVDREKRSLIDKGAKVDKVEWPCASEAARLLLMQCGKSPDSATLDATAALLLFLSDPEEKGGKGGKVGPPPLHYGLTREQAGALLTRVCLGQRVRLTDDGQIETVGETPKGEE